MAPTAPKKRPSIRTKSKSTPGSGAIARLPPRHREGAIISDSFINSKLDKRIIKHSAFVNRIEKAHRQPLKRRRPNKKLVTTMEGLADALPDVEELVKGKESGKGKVEMRSLSSARGFMKRRGKVEKVERERFGMNLGVIMGSSGATSIIASTATPAVAVAGGEGTEAAVAAAAPVSATAGRFAAIRAWVNNNLEKHEDFEKKI